MPEHTDSFGYWLRRRRKALDLTQDALAESVSCSASAIRKIETDERRPSKHLAERLADRLGISPAERAAFLEAARAVHSTANLDVDEEPVSAPYEHAAEPTPQSATNADAHALGQLRGEVFVGRKNEMDALGSALEDVLAGHSRIAMLAGEPGIGKTRTAQELSTHALQRNAQVLWGRCYEGKGAPPYWPWLQVIRSAIQDKDAARLQAEMGHGAAAIAGVVPEICDHLPNIAPPPMLDPEQARFRLFDSITTFLKNISKHQPLVLILDDLHWADHPSLRLLEFIAAEVGDAPMMVVGTYRDVEISRKHPLSQTLAELTRQGHLQRFTLRGLNAVDVGTFIERMIAGAVMPKALAGAVHEQTEGNPLFVTEVVRLLAQEGALDSDCIAGVEGRHLRIPEGVREVIGKRLDRLSDECNRALTIAALIGRQFQLQQLARLMSDVTTHHLLEVLEEALATRVIEALPRGTGHYQFSHALIGETLAEEVPTSRRVRQHAQIGDALEALYGSQAETHAAQLAHHFSEASSLIGHTKLVHYASLAGERALATYAYEEALKHFEQALTAKEGAPMDAQTAGLLFGHARAQMGILERLHFPKAVESFRKAFDCFVAIGDVARAIAIAEFPFPHFPGLEGAMAEFVGKALRLVPEDSLEAGRLLSRNGRILGIHHADPNAAQGAFDRALAIARREGDTVLEIRTLASASYIDYFHLRFREAIAKGERAIMLANGTKELDSELTARYWVASSLRDLGDLSSLRKHAIAAMPAAEKLRNRFWLAGVHWLNENASRLKGEWESAREHSNHGLAWSSMDFRLLWTRALIEYEVGNVDRGDTHIERLIEVMRMTRPGPTPEHALTATAIAMCAAITGASKWTGAAFDAAAIALEHVDRLPAISRMARVGLAMLAMQTGNTALAAEQYAALQGHRKILAFAAGPSADRVLGCLARTVGNLNEARAHFEDAMAFCRSGGFRPELAWTLYNYAEVLVESDQPLDILRAITFLDEALTISVECSMRPLVDRIQHLRQRINSPAPPYGAPHPPKRLDRL